MQSLQKKQKIQTLQQQKYQQPSNDHVRSFSWQQSSNSSQKREYTRLMSQDLSDILGNDIAFKVATGDEDNVDDQALLGEGRVIEGFNGGKSLHFKSQIHSPIVSVTERQDSASKNQTPSVDVGLISHKSTMEDLDNKVDPNLIKRQVSGQMADLGTIQALKRQHSLLNNILEISKRAGAIKNPQQNTIQQKLLKIQKNTKKQILLDSLNLTMDKSYDATEEISGGDYESKDEEGTYSSSKNNHPVQNMMQSSFKNLSRIDSIQQLNIDALIDENIPNRYRYLKVQNAELPIDHDESLSNKARFNRSIAENRRKDNRLQNQLKQKMASIQSLKSLKKISNSQEAMQNSSYKYLEIVPSQLYKQPDKKMKKEETRINKKSIGRLLKAASSASLQTKNNNNGSQSSVSQHPRMIMYRNLESVLKDGTPEQSRAQGQGGTATQRGESRKITEQDQSIECLQRIESIDIDAKIEEILRKKQSIKQVQKIKNYELDCKEDQ